MLAHDVGKRRQQLEELAISLPGPVRRAPYGSPAQVIGGEHLAVGQVLVQDLGTEEGPKPTSAPEVTGR